MRKICFLPSILFALIACSTEETNGPSNPSTSTVTTISTGGFGGEIGSGNIGGFGGNGGEAGSINIGGVGGSSSSNGGNGGMGGSGGMDFCYCPQENNPCKQSGCVNNQCVVKTAPNFTKAYICSSPNPLLWPNSVEVLAGYCVNGNFDTVYLQLCTDVCKSDSGTYLSGENICSNICGNGIFAGSVEEQCDDGNLIDGDGCSSQCQIEQGYECQHDVISSCSLIPPP